MSTPIYIASDQTNGAIGTANYGVKHRLTGINPMGMANTGPAYVNLWDPTQDTGVVTWYDASDVSTITHVDGSVSQIDDKVGTAHQTQTTGSKQPTIGTRTINGLNALDFDGTQYLQHLGYAFPTSGNYAIFVVCEIDTVTNNNKSALSYDATTADFQINARPGNPVAGEFYGTFTSGGNMGFDRISLSAIDRKGINQFNAVLNFSANTIVFTGNGDVTTQTTDYTIKVTEDGDQALKIMSNRDTLHPLDGAIGEFIITSSIDLATQQKIEGYFAWKWGAQAKLGSAHPYKNTPPGA